MGLRMKEDGMFDDLQAMGISLWLLVNRSLVADT
jgi:hypothetical protein